MRIMVFLLVFFLAGRAGMAQTVTLSVHNASLESVFKEIGKQSGYQFVYPGLIGVRPVTLNMKDEPFRKALDSALRGQPFEYTIVKQTVVVRRKGTAAEIAALDKAKAAAVGEISGTVFDSTFVPLSDASVMIMGAKGGTQTDSRGKFVLRGTAVADSNVVIEISYTGYETQRKTIPKGSLGGQVIVLRSSVSELDQIEIVAYGTTTQRYNVGSVATITAKEIEKQPVNNVLEALQGQVAGLQITQTNGAPGSMVLAQIRGQNTLPAGNAGSGVIALADYNQPLYVVDGIPFAPQNTSLMTDIVGAGASLVGSSINSYGGLSPLNSINPLDIESVTILKDADATAIYGSRAANGVILINTKKGKPGKLSTSVSFHDGPTRAARPIKMMNEQQFLQMRHEALANSGLAPSLVNKDYDLLVFDTTQDRDFYHTFNRKAAQHLSTNVSVSGGTNYSSYNFGVGYNYSDFTVPGSFYDKRYSLHGNYAVRSVDGKFNMTLSTNLSYGQNRSASSGSANLINVPPDFPNLTDAKNNLLWSYKGYSYSVFGGTNANPYAGLRRPTASQIYNLNEAVHLSYLLLKGLSFGGTFGVSRSQVRLSTLTPIASQDPATHPTGSASFGDGATTSIDIEPQVNYSRTFGKARISMLVGGTYTSLLKDQTLLSGNQFVNDNLLNYISAAPVIVTGQAPTSNYKTKYAGSFSRIGFIWDNRYIINLTGNVDGSSLFGPGHRWGKFGSAGAGWIFTETRFIKQSLPWLSFGKLSGNYGLTGGYSVSPYQYQQNWAVGGGRFQGSAFYTTQNLYSPDFHWSTTRQVNGTLSLGFFGDRLLVDLNGYQNRTADQLLNVALPSQTGFGSVVDNAPYTVENSGWEITIRGGSFGRANAGRRSFVWNAPSFNMGKNSNKITNIAPNSPYAGVYIKGKSATAQVFVKYGGVNPSTGQFQYYLADGKTLTDLPNITSAFLSKGAGDANQWVDLTPTISFGFGDGFSWNGLNVSFHGEFVKQKGYNYLRQLYGGTVPGTPDVNEPALLLGKQWQKPGDIKSLPRFSEQIPVVSVDAFSQSTGAISDASYLRITNLSISYSVPAASLRRLGLAALAFSLNCQNPLTITGYKVGDPQTQTIYSIPPQRVVSGGINLSF
jgi:TonB-linked SusC/RagA family outer membrane protein